MENNIHTDLQTEKTYTKLIGSNTIEVKFRYKPYNVLKDNGLPCISHLHISVVNQITNKRNGKSHYFHPETLIGYTSFVTFAEDAIQHFIKEGYIVLEQEVQYSLF
jgi:hypothetical protein